MGVDTRTTKDLNVKDLDGRQHFITFRQHYAIQRNKLLTRDGFKK